MMALYIIAGYLACMMAAGYFAGLLRSDVDWPGRFLAIIFAPIGAPVLLAYLVGLAGAAHRDRLAARRRRADELEAARHKFNLAALAEQTAAVKELQ